MNVTLLISLIEFSVGIYLFVKFRVSLDLEFLAACSFACLILLIVFVFLSQTPLDGMGIFFVTDLINFLAFLYRNEEIYGRRSADSDWQKPSCWSRFISASSSWTSHFVYLLMMFSIYLFFFVNWFNRRYCFYWFVVWQSIGFNRGCVNRTGFGWWFCFSGKFSTMLPNNACFYIKVFLYWSWVFFFPKNNDRFAAIDYPLCI